MPQKTIAEIYADNDRVRSELKSTVADISDEQASILPEGEKWTIAQIVEHISIVEDGMGRVCNKLLRKAEADGMRSDGNVTVSDHYIQKGAEIASIKVEAPERVRPTGNVPIVESLEKLDYSRGRLDELLPLFETVDSASYTFPHPFFGEISAAEWLTLIGEHEARHLEQIKRRLVL